MKPKCPECRSSDLRFFKLNQRYSCNNCGNGFRIAQIKPDKLRIFLSYGHDTNEDLVRIIKADLEKRGHDVWFDKKDIKFGDDWRHEITDGIVKSDQFISFLSKHSTRNPGVCLDEIAIAIGTKGGNISTILVENEIEVKAPPSISHIQWLDMHDWKEQKAKDKMSWNEWYQDKLDEIISVVESEESRQFAGEIEKLSQFLKPISSDSRISELLSKGFVGREWIWNEIEKWRSNIDRSSRLFWIMGGPGVGKSAFAANFTHFGKDKIIASQFCEWNKPAHRNAARVFRSIAFQLATRLPDYRKLLLTLPEINQLEGKNAAEIFEYLFANPLQRSIEGGRERYLILIDALDEASEGERNPLVDTLAMHAPELPEWLGILITSRPESSVTSPLHGLKPFVLDTETEKNKNDIRLYLHRSLERLFKNRTDAEYLIEQILAKSEGVFLYIERVCGDLNKGFLSLDNLEYFPIGLGGIFKQFFDRQFPDLEYFRTIIRPALRCILAAPEPLPLVILKNLFNWQEEEMYDFVRVLGSLFTVITEAGRKVIKPYHKSLIDWLTNHDASDHYYVNTLEGHRFLVDYSWPQFNNNLEILDIYFIKWLPHHLKTLERWDDLVNILCNLDYIQIKSATKLTFDLIKDFNDALEFVPDNLENIWKQKEQQARLDKYAKDLILYVKGEITKIDNPDSITYLTEEQIDTEIKRIKTKPTKTDFLTDFLNFLRNESSDLQNTANKFNHFTHQQAWNYAIEGPVGNAADVHSLMTSRSLLCRHPATRPPWNPLPSAIQILKGHSSGVRTVSITPDGKYAISGSHDNTCILWDMNRGDAIKSLRGHTDWVNTISITPDGKYAISGSKDNTCIFWELNSGDAIKTLRGHTSGIRAVSITPDGKYAVSGSMDYTCILWDLNNGDAIKILTGHTSGVRAISISAEGKYAFSGSSDTTCILWNLNSGNAIKILKGHTSKVWAVSITPDGKHAVSGSWDKTCILWDLNTGSAVKTLKGHTDWVNAVSITSDGKYAVSGSSDNTCILWDLDNGSLIKKLKGHTSRVWAVSITPDGKYAVSGSMDKTCILWDLNGSDKIKTWKGHTSRVYAVSITPDGKYAVSGSWDKTCILWELNTGDAIKTLKGHTDWVNAVSITPDGKYVLSGSNDNTCILWDLNTGNKIKTLKGHTDWVNTVSITPDGNYAVSVSEDNTCILWNLNSGDKIKTLKGHSSGVRVISITPDGKYAVSGSNDNTCILWDLNTGNRIKTLKGHTSRIWTVSISPNGKYVVSGSEDKTCILWNLKRGVKLKTLSGHNSGVRTVSITPDGKYAVSGSGDNTCIVWNLNSGDKINTLKGHNSSVRAVSITLDGKYVVSVSSDNTCILWEMATGKQLAQFRNSPATTIALNSVDIILGYESGEVVILNVERDFICSGIAVTSIRQIWDFGLNQYQPHSANCPLCGHRFTPPDIVLATIKKISKKASLRPEQAPCFELPYEAWEHPELLSACPNCRENLKFTPFIVGGD